MPWLSPFVAPIPAAIDFSIQLNIIERKVVLIFTFSLYIMAKLKLYLNEEAGDFTADPLEEEEAEKVDPNDGDDDSDDDEEAVDEGNKEEPESFQ